MTLNWGDVPTWVASVGTVAAFGATFWALQVQRNEIKRERQERFEAETVARRKVPVEAIVEAQQDTTWVASRRKWLDASPGDATDDKPTLQNVLLLNAYRLLLNESKFETARHIGYPCDTIDRFNAWQPHRSTIEDQVAGANELRRALDGALNVLNDQAEQTGIAPE
jgi:hypothetical protein